VETHISWVFLTGSYAYKVKKPVDFGFLDFSTLGKRHHYCDEEVRCNRRFAPDLYLDVVTIAVADDGGINVGGSGEIVEYAVRMRQFPSSAELDERLANADLPAAELAAFGRELAAIHRRLPRVEAGTRFGTATAVHEPVLENFNQIAGTGFQAEFEVRLAKLLSWSNDTHAKLAEGFDERRAAGCVRECHGDLHLSNMVTLDGAITAFDCIEFNPGLRWIDVISDAAFLVMDCLVRDRHDLGYAFLDAYLAATGDYPGGRMLGYYLVYRSMVRAKVAALQADAEGAHERFERHLAFAEARALSAHPVLLLTCGLSGSGKSWLAQRLVSTYGAVRIRSDVERKRLHGLSANARSDSKVGEGIYGPDATERVYQHLQDCARAMLLGGERVIVDATFLDSARRETFITLARDLAVPVVTLFCTAPLDVLQARVASRTAEGHDPSEADTAVLARQREGFIPPVGEGVISVATHEDVDVVAVVDEIRRKIA
jgi:aminoglycoside phosphotransferase family enzyme/predicted kinase